MQAVLKVVFRAFCLISVLSACGESTRHQEDARILVMGDSLLAWNGGTSQSVSDRIEERLKEPVIDRSVSAARILYKLPLTGAAGLSIPKQFRPGNWDWVIVNGGGNDLWLGCGCLVCSRKMDRLVSEDGSAGAIPKMVSKLRGTGARVIYSGYLRSPGRNSPIEGCKQEGQELEVRLQRMANLDEGVIFLPLDQLVPHRDLSFHAADRIHPSVKGSASIGDLIADLIVANER